MYINCLSFSLDCSPSCYHFQPEFSLIALWVLGSFGLSFHFTKTLTFGNPELHQEAAEASRNTKQNNIINSIKSEDLFKLSEAREERILFRKKNGTDMLDIVTCCD